MPDIDAATDMFMSMMLEICNKHAPYTNLKRRDFAPPWITSKYLSAVDSWEYWSKKYRKNLNETVLANKNLAIAETVRLKKDLQQSYFS